MDADSSCKPHAHGAAPRAFVPLDVAVLSVSDTRTLTTDRSGAWIAEQLMAAGHRLVERRVVPDEIAAIRTAVSAWCALPQVRAVIVTGGTGVTARDVTPEALEPLFDKPLAGFGELFRMLSYAEIGAAAIQSRATAGLLRGRVIFAVPGSTGACRLALEKIILPQLDARTAPCSFAGLMVSA
jgi:molybdenum cofactor biosynthesis protein B